MVGSMRLASHRHPPPGEGIPGIIQPVRSTCSLYKCTRIDTRCQPAWLIPYQGAGRDSRSVAIRYAASAGSSSEDLVDMSATSWLYWSRNTEYARFSHVTKGQTEPTWTR